MTTSDEASRTVSAGSTGRDLVRALCGAVLLGVPLLFTMELWASPTWFGLAWAPAALAATVVVATVLDRTAGFRFTAERTWRSSFADGLEVVAASLAVATAVLVLTGRIDGSSSWASAVPQVVVQALPLSVGASIASEILGGADVDDDPASGRPGHSPISLLGGAALGAAVVGLSIAPTDEVVVIAADVGLWRSLGLIGASLAASHAIVFSADFGRRRRPADTRAGRLAHTGVAYGAAVVVAAVLLVVSGRMDGLAPLTAWTRVIALSFPTAIGAAAGRLAV